VIKRNEPLVGVSFGAVRAVPRGDLVIRVVFGAGISAIAAIRPIGCSFRLCIQSDGIKPSQPIEIADMARCNITDLRTGLEIPWRTIDTARGIFLSHKALFDRVTGTDTGAYRTEHLNRCVERTTRSFGMLNIEQLLEELEHDREVTQRFRRSFFIGVTSVFRDVDEYRNLERILHDQNDRNEAVARVWSAGCSYGDELASVYELMSSRPEVVNREFIGTDVSVEAITQASRRCLGDPCTIRESSLKFMIGDLLKEEGPDGEFDLILYRNVSIYLKRTHRDAIISFLSARLNSNGLLMLGKSESITKPREYGLERLTRSLYQRTV